MRFRGERGNMCRNGFVQDAEASTNWCSAHESTPKTRSAYSQEAVHHHSFTKIASMRGSVLWTTSWCHLMLPRIELPLPKCMIFVGVGMCDLPVKFLLPTRS